MTKTLLLAGAAGLSLIVSNFISGASYAQDASLTLDDGGVHAGHQHHKHDHSLAPAAPVGVMGDHLHGKGEWMVSYRFMHMDMDGNRSGTDDISAEEIATTVANRFAGVAGQPGTLRVVPTEMQMDMHMIGAMYGVTDWLTVMGMGNYIEKSMDHVTFQGGAGTTRLGTFETESSGWGDTMIGGLIRGYQDEMHSVHFNVGLSLPTGSIKETDVVLAPNGATPRLRLPYAMQLGTGTYDLHPGVTYTGHQEKISWGAQYKGEIRLEDENSQGYSFGDKHGVTAWGGYLIAPWINTTFRLSASTQDDIDGIDANIVAPVQTADPDNYGGEVVDAGIGVNLIGTHGWTRGHEIGVEFTLPLYQDLNGPQLERDYALTAGWSKSF